MTRAHLNGQSTDERILLALKRGPQTVMELSACLVMPVSTIRKALVRLLYEVERRPISGAQRGMTYHLTEIGRQRVAMLEWRRKQV
jgi:hypothetical protein